MLILIKTLIMNIHHILCKCREKYCHDRDQTTCAMTSGCVNKPEGCRQKHCWGRLKSVCSYMNNNGVYDGVYGKTGCVYNETNGCRMKCDHIENKENYNKLNECN